MVMTAAIVLKQAWKTEGPMRPSALMALSLAVPVDSWTERVRAGRGRRKRVEDEGGGRKRRLLAIVHTPVHTAHRV